MATKHQAYRIALPELTQDQIQKLLRWCDRSARTYELTNGNELVLLLGEQRTQREIGNTIRIYLQRWGATLPKYQRNVISGMSEGEFWKTVEPANLTQKILGKVYRRTGERLALRSADVQACYQRLAHSLLKNWTDRAREAIKPWVEAAEYARNRKREEELVRQRKEDATTRLSKGLERTMERQMREAWRKLFIPINFRRVKGCLPHMADEEIWASINARL